MDNSQKSASPYVLPSPEAEYSKSLTKMEAFTMAAMQGLCANSAFNGPVGADQTPEGILAQVALRIALATLAELSKHQ